METKLIVFRVLFLISFGADAVGSIYFAVVSRHWQSYFDDRHWAYLIFIFICYSAVVSTLTFIRIISTLPPFGRSSSEMSRKDSNRCIELIDVILDLAIIVLLVFHIIGMIHVLNWWHLFDADGLTHYARQCRALFGIMMVIPGLVAFALIVIGIQYFGGKKQVTFPALYWVGLSKNESLGTL
jgi:hypothetical protein